MWITNLSVYATKSVSNIEDRCGSVHMGLIHCLVMSFRCFVYVWGHRVTCIL